jgi:hypothetical protein
VRHLIVSSIYASTQTIVPILESLQDLSSLSWNVDKHMPAAVLDCFHHQHPDAHLKVTNHDRQGTVLTNILASPQLRVLDITVGCIPRGDFLSLAHVTEFPVLQDVVIRGDSLKVRCLGLSRLEYGSTVLRMRFEDSPAVDIRPSNTQFEDNDGDGSPELKRDVIRQSEAYLEPGLDMASGDAKQCADLVQPMDWRHINTLDLGFTNCGLLLKGS